MERKPWYKRKFIWFLAGFLVILSIGSLVLYNSINRMLTQALYKSYDSNIFSDVYELKFEDLSVNILEGNIRVSKVVIQPWEKPLENYPYINSSFKLTTNELLLKNVKIWKLLNSQILDLERIEIDNPEVVLTLAGAIHVLFPFKDSTRVTLPGKKFNKKAIDSFHLKKFEMIGANLTTTNSYEQREFKVSNLNFAFNELFISQHFGLDSLTCKSLELSIDSAEGTLLKSGIRNIGFKNFKFEIDKMEVQKTIDTVMFHFDDFNTALNDLYIQTADSIFNIALKTFALSYKDKSIKFKGIEFKPNISEAELQKRYKYQQAQFSARVGSLEIVNLNFDSVIYQQKIFIDELVLDSVTAAVFKDKTKPLDLKRFPEYLGQQVRTINFPLEIKKITVNKSAIFYRERKPDGNYAKVTVNKLNAVAYNVSTLTTDKPLVIDGEAVLDNAAAFKIKLTFDYIKPQFSMDATIGKFNLINVNNMLRNFTPAKINSGIVDELSFSGIAYRTKATGTFKFLYHDLNIDLQLKKQAQWKSDLGTFAANTMLNSANPVSDDQPPHIVKYEAERNMNKGFINIVLKSLFAGLKETMLPSKENRKSHQEAKKERKIRDDKK